MATAHAPDYNQAKWGTLARRLLRNGERQACTRTDAVICVASWYAQQLAQAYHCTPDVIPNGPGLSTEHSGSDNGFACERGLTDSPYVLCVGRLIAEKHFEDVIAAVTALGTDLKVVIVGDSADSDEYAARWRPKAAKGRRSSARWSAPTWPRSTATPTCSRSPRARRDFPVSLLEAMQFGLPCIATRIQANLEVLGEAGLLYDTSDIAGLTDAMRTLQADEPLRTRLAAAGRARVAEHFHWETIADKTLAVYRRVLSAP